MDQLNVVNILRRHFPQNFEVFTWDEVYDLFRGENCFICREGTDVSVFAIVDMDPSINLKRNLSCIHAV